ncbi:MAG TPA: tetratricopeptide repeat protein [Acidobacteriaceae bacterium]|jgi:predicted Zn-dependent protease
MKSGTDLLGGCGVVLLMAALGARALSGQAAPTQLPAAPSSPVSLVAAQKLVQEGRSAEALRALDPLAAQKPEPAGVEKLRGLALYQQTKLEDAAAAFARAAAADPNDIEAAQMQGVTLFRMGRPADAIPLLERSREQKVAAANVDGNYVLGLCYMDTRRYDDARRAFAAQYGFPPDGAEAYLLSARLLFRREYLPAAIAAAEKAEALAPKMPLVHELLGEIALARSRGTDAITEFEQERAINPLYGGLYDRLGDAYLRAGEYDKAQQALNRAVLLEPASTGPYILLGKVLLKQRNAAMATMYLERARNMDPNNFMTHSLLGQAYRAAGRTEDAERETAKAVELQAATAPKLSKP